MTLEFEGVFKGDEADGVVTAYSGKCELGQGMQTAQIQLIAECGFPVPDTLVAEDLGERLRPVARLARQAQVLE